MKKILFSLFTLCLFNASTAVAEDTNFLPVLTFGDVINAIEDRCPCVDIIESREEELREDKSPLDEIEDWSPLRCRALVLNPGKFRQSFRYLANVGLFKLGANETPSNIRMVFKEGQNSCRILKERPKPQQ